MFQSGWGASRLSLYVLGSMVGADRLNWGGRVSNSCVVTFGFDFGRRTLSWRLGDSVGVGYSVGVSLRLCDTLCAGFRNPGEFWASSGAGGGKVSGLCGSGGRFFADFTISLEMKSERLRRFPIYSIRPSYTATVTTSTMCVQVTRSRELDSVKVCVCSWCGFDKAGVLLVEKSRKKERKTRRKKRRKKRRKTKAVGANDN